VQRARVDVVPVVNLGADLATLRAETGLKLRDCCVLLAARDSSASDVLTSDERLAKAAAGRGVSPVSAAAPAHAGGKPQHERGEQQ
jgi:predicted nucleic acid-binding protein